MNFELIENAKLRAYVEKIVKAISHEEILSIVNEEVGKFEKEEGIDILKPLPKETAELKAKHKEVTKKIGLRIQHEFAVAVVKITVNFNWYFDKKIHGTLALHYPVEYGDTILTMVKFDISEKRYSYRFSGYHK
jgi:folate-dependent tRNA-U54 methylase TrmFO/GidA